MLQLLCTLQIAAGGLRERLSRAARRLSEDRGASTVEWVIITGFLIALAALVGRAIYSMVADSTSNLELPEVGGGG